MSSFKQGDIIWIDLNPVMGHEQAGKRPALVVSNDSFQHYTGLLLICPISSNMRYFPVHIPLDSRTETRGQILVEHVRSIDPAARNAAKKEECPADILENVLDILDSFC